MAFYFSRHILVLFLAAGIVACGGSDNTSIEAPPTTEIYMETGQTQCNDDGLTLEEVRSFLTDVDISPIDESCGSFTGLGVAAVCGGATLSVYVFTIELDDLDTAENIGFNHVPDAIDEANGVGIQRTDC